MLSDSAILSTTIYLALPGHRWTQGHFDQGFARTNCSVSFGRRCPSGLRAADLALSGRGINNGRHLFYRVGEDEMIEARADVAWAMMVEPRVSFPTEGGSSYYRRRFGTPEGTRTPDRRVRNPLLYPAELRARTPEIMTPD